MTPYNHSPNFTNIIIGGHACFVNPNPPLSSTFPPGSFQPHPDCPLPHSSDVHSHLQASHGQYESGLQQQQPPPPPTENDPPDPQRPDPQRQQYPSYSQLNSQHHTRPHTPFQSSAQHNPVPPFTPATSSPPPSQTLFQNSRQEAYTRKFATIAQDLAEQLEYYSNNVPHFDQGAPVVLVHEPPSPRRSTECAELGIHEVSTNADGRPSPAPLRPSFGHIHHNASLEQPVEPSGSGVENRTTRSVPLDEIQSNSVYYADVVNKDKNTSLSAAAAGQAPSPEISTSTSLSHQRGEAGVGKSRGKGSNNDSKETEPEPRLDPSISGAQREEGGNGGNGGDRVGRMARTPPTFCEPEDMKYTYYNGDWPSQEGQSRGEEKEQQPHADPIEWSLNRQQVHEHSSSTLAVEPKIWNTNRQLQLKEQQRKQPGDDPTDSPSNQQREHSSTAPISEPDAYYSHYQQQQRFQSDVTTSTPDQQQELSPPGPTFEPELYYTHQQQKEQEQEQRLADHPIESSPDQQQIHSHPAPWPNLERTLEMARKPDHGLDDLEQQQHHQHHQHHQQHQQQQQQEQERKGEQERQFEAGTLSSHTADQGYSGSTPTESSTYQQTKPCTPTPTQGTYHNLHDIEKQPPAMLSDRQSHYDRISKPPPQLPTSEHHDWNLLSTAQRQNIRALLLEGKGPTISQTWREWIKSKSVIEW
ncbi:MAG: hypothetical protein Q9192_002506 [Flavoplaca navasiana]